MGKITNLRGFSRNKGSSSGLNSIVCLVDVWPTTADSFSVFALPFTLLISMSKSNFGNLLATIWVVSVNALRGLCLGKTKSSNN